MDCQVSIGHFYLVLVELLRTEVRLYITLVDETTILFRVLEQADAVA